MPVAIDSSSAVSEGAASSRTFALNNAAGTGVIVRVASFGRYPTGVTYAAEALNAGPQATSTEDDRSTIWTLFTGVNTGNNNVVVTFASSTESVCWADSVTGEDGTTPIQDTETDTEGLSVTTTSMPAISGTDEGLVFDCLSWFGDRAMAAGLGQSQQFNENNTTAQESGAGSTKAGASSVTMVWTWTGGTRYAMTAVSIAPGAGGGGGDAVPQVWMQYRARTIH